MGEKRVTNRSNEEQTKQKSNSEYEPIFLGGGVQLGTSRARSLIMGWRVFPLKCFNNNESGVQHINNITKHKKYNTITKIYNTLTHIKNTDPFQICFHFGLLSVFATQICLDIFHFWIELQRFFCCRKLQILTPF